MSVLSFFDLGTACRSLKNIHIQLTLRLLSSGVYLTLVNNAPVILRVFTPGVFQRQVLIFSNWFLQTHKTLPQQHLFLLALANA